MGIVYLIAFVLMIIHLICRIVGEYYENNKWNSCYLHVNGLILWIIMFLIPIANIMFFAAWNILILLATLEDEYRLKSNLIKNEKLINFLNKRII